MTPEQLTQSVQLKAEAYEIVVRSRQLHMRLRQINKQLMELQQSKGESDVKT